MTAAVDYARGKGLTSEVIDALAVRRQRGRHEHTSDLLHRLSHAPALRAPGGSLGAFADLAGRPVVVVLERSVRVLSGWIPFVGAPPGDAIGVRARAYGSLIKPAGWTLSMMSTG
jgi:hypothetical protein